jgi:hypothetical protein
MVQLGILKRGGLFFTNQLTRFCKYGIVRYIKGGALCLITMSI